MQRSSGTRLRPHNLFPTAGSWLLNSFSDFDFYLRCVFVLGL